MKPPLAFNILRQGYLKELLLNETIFDMSKTNFFKLLKIRNSFPHWSSFFLEGQCPQGLLGLMLEILNP